MYGKTATPTGTINYVLAIINLVGSLLLIGHIFIMINHMKNIKKSIELEEKIKGASIAPMEKTSLTIASI